MTGLFNRISTVNLGMPKPVGITSSDDSQSLRKNPVVQRSEKSISSKSFPTRTNKVVKVVLC